MNVIEKSADNNRGSCNAIIDAEFPHEEMSITKIESFLMKQEHI